MVTAFQLDKEEIKQLKVGWSWLALARVPSPLFAWRRFFPYSGCGVGARGSLVSRVVFGRGGEGGVSPRVPVAHGNCS